jgi:ABC-2 type transport system permease protein
MKIPPAFRRTLSIAYKEVLHVRRDPFTLGMALGLPIVLLGFFGYAINFDLRDIRVAVFDNDQSRASRELVEVFNSSEYFRITKGQGTGPGMLDREETKGALIIEKGFQKDLGSGRGSKAQFLLDGADNSTAGVIAGYLAGIRLAAGARLSGKPVRYPLNIRTRFLFNPELNSHWFVVPGLAVIIMGLLSTLLTALTVAREWENGSMEMLLSTPVRPLEIILGKILPYMGLCLLGAAMVYACARLAFGVPFRGNHLIFLAGVVLFLGACLNQGIIISVVTREQRTAFQLGMLTALLPSMLLSGFIFPIQSMPFFFRALTAVLPARWFMVVCRSVFLKTTEFRELALPMAVLAGMSAVLIVVARMRFKTDVEP